MHHPWMRTCSSRGTSRTRHANEARAASQSTDACMVRIIGWPLPAVVQPCRICLEVGTATMGARRSRLAANPRRSDRWRVRGRSDRERHATATRRGRSGDSIHRARVWALWCRRRILPRARTMLDCYTHGPSSPTVPLPSEEGNRLGFRANTFK